MKYKIILFVGFVFIVCIFAVCTKRTTYYGNSGEKIITEKFFDFDCLLIEPTANAPRKLEINFDFHNVTRETLKQLSVIPISNNKDTLKMKSEYASGLYTFLFPAAEKTKRLDLILNYKVDSAGFTINKSSKYYNLEKINTYSFRPTFL